MAPGANQAERAQAEGHTNKALEINTGEPDSTSLASQQPRSELKDQVEALALRRHLERQKQRHSCLSFVEVIIFMASFLILMWTHEDIRRVYELERVVKLTMSEPFGDHSYTYADIKDVHGMWQWVDLSLLPALVKHKDEVGKFSISFIIGPTV